MKRMFRLLITIIGIVLGAEVQILIERFVGYSNLIHRTLTSVNLFIIYVVGGLIGGIIFYLLAPVIIRKCEGLTTVIEKRLQKRSVHELVIGTAGLIIGLIIATLISNGPVGLIPFPWLSMIISILLYFILGYLGISIGMKKQGDFANMVGSAKRFGLKDGAKDKTAKAEQRVRPKVLDTSVIIDGRISDIVKTGFIEGTLVIPVFVLDELRHISDSSDGLKRNRGRRGLDILNKIQKEMDNKVEITDKDFDDIAEVDMKLLKLAQTLGGVVVTNDYNLNKVAEFQGVPVLNINELANAVKPVVLPGEEMTIQVVKDGKESGQGLAYLDDGTMIVVEGGRKYIGETIGVLVTSVLQTAAGRMIFVKPKAAA